MTVNLHYTFNASDVADAVFSGMMLREERNGAVDVPSTHKQTLQRLLTSIDADLNAAGLTFAEYLERVRHLRQSTPHTSKQYWRFSARERAVQRVDSSVAHLCALMRHAPLNS